MVHLRHSTFIAMILCLMTRPVTAADGWAVASVRGTVLMQLGNQWTEIETGDSIANDVPVRTLQAGHVELRRPAEVMQLAPNTVIRADDAGSLVRIEQYAGQLTLIGSRERKYLLVTPSFAASTGGASVVSSIVNGRASLMVRSGRVPVRMKQRNLVLLSGQTVSSGAGSALTVTDQNFATSGITGATGAIGDQSDGGPKTDQGVGNGGIPGNGGQNGNGNSGNGNGNSGGNGNGKDQN